MATEGEDEGHEEDEAMATEDEDIFGEAPKTKRKISKKDSCVSIVSSVASDVDAPVPGPNNIEQPW